MAWSYEADLEEIRLPAVLAGDFGLELCLESGGTADVIPAKR